MKEFTIIVNHPVAVTIQAETYEDAVKAICAQYHLSLSEPLDFSLVVEQELEPQEADKQLENNKKI